MKLKVAEIALKGSLNSIETHVTNQRVKENGFIEFCFHILSCYIQLSHSHSNCYTVKPLLGGNLRNLPKMAAK